MQERLYVEAPPFGTTRLTNWIRESRGEVGCASMPASWSAGSIGQARTAARQVKGRELLDGTTCVAARSPHVRAYSTWSPGGQEC
jgi:hypothetical protein